MSPRIDSAAVVAVVMIVAVAISGVAGAATTEQLSVGVAQDGADVTVSVTANDTAVENATVSVTALDNSSYADAGEYVTDANGTVSLSAPEENVTVEVSAQKGNASDSITVDLVAVEGEDPEFDSFGQRVSWFVHSLLGDDTDGGIGQAVSEFVKSNNPSNDNKPDHAGKSDNANKPDHAGNSENGTSGGGPPEHAKKDKSSDEDEQ